MTELLLIEDDDGVAGFIRRGLEEEGYAVTRARTAAEGTAAVGRRPFAVVVLDLRLPDGSGLDLCRELRRHNAELPVLMLTALNRPADRVAGLHAGADDYLGKPFVFDELLARLAALERRALLAPAPRAFDDGAVTLDPVAHTATADGRPLDLTPTEFDLLALFVARRGQVLPRDEVHTRVWGADFDRGTNLLDVYVGYLRRKLAHAGSPARIETVRGVGFRYTSGPP